MKKIVFSALIMCSLTNAMCPPSVIKSVDSFSVLEKQLNTIDTKALVVFDIDNTLIIETDPMDRGFDTERTKAKTVNAFYVPGSELDELLDRATQARLWSIYTSVVKRQILDPSILPLIRKLQTKKIKVVALTRFPVGKIGVLDSVDEFRIKNLKKLGIDFRDDTFSDIVFEQFSLEDKHPLFKAGILFTTLACSKGQLLKAFLEKTKFTPTKVIMFDDKITELNSVAKSLKKINILFEGYEYQGATNEPAYFDKAVAEFQMQYLIDNEEWITSEQAQEQM